MRSRVHHSHGITHSLTPFLEESHRELAEYDLPSPKRIQYTPLYQPQTHYNPHKQRSRKHRLMEEKNTDIERENRRLYEKLRKIKLKNAFQSEQKLSMDVIPEVSNFGSTITKPLSLPPVDQSYLRSTKSELNSILNDRKTFVNKYFDELSRIRGKAKKTEELGNFVVNGWKIKTLLLDDQAIVLRGRKNGKELTKKYVWARVKARMASGLQAWVRLKFEFEE